MGIVSGQSKTSIAAIANLDSLEVSFQVSRSLFGIQFLPFAIVNRLVVNSYLLFQTLTEEFRSRSFLTAIATASAGADNTWQLCNFAEVFPPASEASIASEAHSQL